MRRESAASSEREPLRLRWWIGWSRLAPSRKDSIYLSVMIAVQVVSTIFWLHWDTRPMPAADANNYLRKSLLAWDILRQGDIDKLAGLVELDPIRPSLYEILATPLYSFGKLTADVAVLTNMFFAAMAILATYGLGKLLFCRSTGLLAAFVLSMNPTLANESRVYWPHYATVGMVALCLYLLISTRGFSHWQYSLLFGLSLGTALLIRPIHPALHLLGPALLLGLGAVRDSIRCVKSRLRGNVMSEQAVLMHSPSRLLVNSTVAVFGLSIALVWYIPNSGAVFGAAADKVLNPKNIDPLSLKSFVWYATAMPRTLSWFFVVLLTIGVFLALVRFRRQNGVLLAGLAVSYAGLVLNRGKAVYYISPLFPIISILSVFWVLRIKNSRIRAAIIAAVVLVGVLNYTLVSWSILPPDTANRVVSSLGGRPERDPILWNVDFVFQPRPPRREIWPNDEIVTEVHSSARYADIRALLVGQAFYLNAHQLRYLSTLHGIQHPDGGQGGTVAFNRPRLDSPDLYVELLDGDYIVWLKGRFRRHKDLHARANQLLDALPPSFSQRFSLVQNATLPDGRMLFLFRRAQPRIANLPPADLPVLMKDAIQVDPWSPKAHLLLSHALLQQGDPSGAIAAFDEALHLYEEAIQSVPTYGTQDDATYANLWKHVGEGLYEIGQYERAVAACEREIDLKPARANAYIRLGRAYEELDRTEEARAAYEEALRLDPSRQRVRQRLLDLYPNVELDIQHPLWQDLGGVLAFLGFNTEPRSVPAGATVDVTLWWQALADMDRDYTVFIHIVDRDGHIWAQEDRVLQRGDYPTSTWLAGETARAEYELDLPLDTPPGEYMVKAGIYYWETRQRLPVHDANQERVPDDAILLEPIVVDR